MEVNLGLAEQAGKGVGWHMAMRCAIQTVPPITAPGILLCAPCFKSVLLTLL